MPSVADWTVPENRTGLTDNEYVVGGASVNRHQLPLGLAILNDAPAESIVVRGHAIEVVSCSLDQGPTGTGQPSESQTSSAMRNWCPPLLCR